MIKYPTTFAELSKAIKHTTNPTITENLPAETVWVNTTTGEFFVCIDDTIDNNQWRGQLGTFITSSTLYTVDIFKDNSGLLLYQFDGNSQDAGGQYVGATTNITYENGKFGKCAVFNGSNSKIENLSFDINAYDAITFSFWMSTTTTSDSKMLGFSGSNDMAIETTDGTTCKVYFRSNLNSTDVSDFFINDGTWHHYAFVIDSNGTNHYKDGSSITTTGQVKSSVDKPFDIGEVGGGNYFNGKIDQVRIFNRALTDDEVGQLYNEK